MDDNISMDGDTMEDVDGKAKKFSACSILTCLPGWDLRLRNTD